MGAFDRQYRMAVVRGGDSKSIANYMPGNYEAVQYEEDTLIVGSDIAGWTLEDYIIPRLASGLYFAEVIR